ncbi:ATP-dependent RNA helicase dbp7 [Coniosporium apollinis]|uniref:ATP-dependent RNA helicase n=1 Tax=Coniosporium apollinis TaxID=61459 RepID=A0ABQ9P448_9PEZI|nr:ATP-dependent RNA helicase dbp7 [Coniosporium apollinis]
MTDDGMLLNFSVGDAPLIAKPSFKGGSWKDRLSAKKAALHRQKKLAQPSTGQPDAPPENTSAREESDFPVNRPAKRQRTETDFRPTAPAGAPRGAGQTNGDRSERRTDGPKQVISSLFTYNPTSTSRGEAKTAEAPDADVEPSNAPLSSELDTFTSLGLSPTIASHLLNKLGIKAPTAIQKAAVSQLLKEDSDAFIQAETGSGKTLAYLLPIVQRIMALSKATKTAEESNEADGVHRDSGLFAIILAPTRELSKQISVVLESLLRCAHWIVAGTVQGGEKKKSEKARLRKGLNILVATPGRLADHLDNTEALDVSNVRWLVLDEGDRLMELGFEDEIQKIVSKLNMRMKAAQLSKTSKIPGLPTRRTTVLCSATMKMNVQRLGEISLKEAVHIQAASGDKLEDGAIQETKEDIFSAPAQLRQSYAIVPAKLRLVSLIALLKRTFARRGSVMKAIVFISCADSVDFHFEILSRDLASQPADSDAPHPITAEAPNASKPASTTQPPPSRPSEPRTSAPSPTLSSPNNPIQTYRLHGSLPQTLRTSTLKSFSASKDPAVLLCTDVASRGLDLPNVDFVIEYDPAFSKDDHLHRVGRTARAGRQGRAMVFLMPGCEEGYVSLLAEGRREGEKALSRQDANELLRKGFISPAATGTEKEKERGWQDRATEWQLSIERWALDSPSRLEMARRAFQSHVRAYATHVAAERACFDIKQLHLGHLAKAFALRDRPGRIGVPGMRPGADGGKGKGERREVARRKGGAERGEGDEGAAGGAGVTEEAAARRKMRAMARAMGGASEFNLG